MANDEVPDTLHHQPDLLLAVLAVVPVRRLVAEVQPSCDALVIERRVGGSSLQFIVERDVKGLLGRQVPQARQMLRKLLADKIDIEPVGSGRQRGFKFRGALTVDRLISGDTIVGTNNTPVSGGPNGIW